MSRYVRSADGTRIAYDRQGAGPGVILVGGAMQFRGFDPTTVEMAALLADRGFTVINFDRRGRGESHADPPLSLAANIADIAALAAELDGPVALYGNSSGGSISLAAAAAGLPVSHLVLFEVPLGPEGGADGADFLAGLRGQIADRDGDSIVAYFMKDMPPEMLSGARQSPGWPVMVGMGPSLEADAESIAWTQSAPRRQLWSGITQPTLVLVGSQTMPKMMTAAQSIVESLGNARMQSMGAVRHGWSPAEMSTLIADFLSS
jgi:pimeloyl-ACP methyl ester carboxylesterase